MIGLALLVLGLGCLYNGNAQLLKNYGLKVAVTSAQQESESK